VCRGQGYPIPDRGMPGCGGCVGIRWAPTRGVGAGRRVWFSESLGSESEPEAKRARVGG
jgi:hypothetical protein